MKAEIRKSQYHSPVAWRATEQMQWMQMTLSMLEKESKESWMIILLIQVTPSSSYVTTRSEWIVPHPWSLKIVPSVSYCSSTWHDGMNWPLFHCPCLNPKPILWSSKSKSVFRGEPTKFWQDHANLIKKRLLHASFIKVGFFIKFTDEKDKLEGKLQRSFYSLSR